jgi:hypothetical protein
LLESRSLPFADSALAAVQKFLLGLLLNLKYSLLLFELTFRTLRAEIHKNVSNAVVEY